MKLVLLALIVLGLAWLLWPPTHRATAVPEAGLEITMSIRPMQGFHSDWHRSISITHDGKKIEKRLFGDTGWWRGSNLYRHISGAYVVHEGQGWCFAFTLDPLEFDSTFEASCVKGRFEFEESDARSHYYKDLEYLGHFYETWRDEEGVRIRYSDAGRTPEVELPDGP